MALLFESGIPDTHMGFYSKNVLGVDSEIQQLYVDGSPISGWFNYSWFLGFFLPRPGTTLMNPTQLDYTAGALWVYIKTGSAYTGWVYYPGMGWLFLSPYVNFEDNHQSGFWFWNQKNSTWIYAHRYFCINNYILGDDAENFNNIPTSDSLYWVKSILALSADPNNSNKLMTPGQGILSITSYGGSSSNDVVYCLIKPYGGPNVADSFKMFYKRGSSIYSLDLAP